jgi:hypothetical protein
MTPRAVIVFQGVGGLQWVGVNERLVGHTKSMLRDTYGTPAIAVIRLRRQTTESETCDAFE